MDIFTEEALRNLNNGNTPTDRVNNAISFIRFRNPPVNELIALISDIKLNWQNYIDAIWIADSVEYFIHSLEQECESKIFKANSITPKEPENKKFVNRIQQFNEAFIVGIRLFDYAKDNSVNEEYLQTVIEYVKYEGDSFLQSIYQKIALITDWDEVDRIYVKVERILDKRIYDNSFWEVQKDAEITNINQQFEIDDLLTILNKICNLIRSYRSKHKWLYGFGYGFCYYAKKKFPHIENLNKREINPFLAKIKEFNCEIIAIKESIIQEEEVTKFDCTPTDEFNTFFHYKDMELLKTILYPMLKGKKGKGIAVTLRALERLNIINIDKIKRAKLYKMLRDEMKIDAPDAGINECLKINDKREAEITTEVRILKKQLNMQ